MVYSLMFIEPPKDYWFLMGEYLPPPTTLLVLAAYIEKNIPDVEIEVVDSQAEKFDWKDVEKRIASTSPNAVATSGFTCNAYTCAKVAELAKKVDIDITTILGGQHFTSTADESLANFSEIDYIVRGEGEITLSELIKCLKDKKDCSNILGITFRRNGKIVNTPPRPLIENLDSLPFPAYHLVEKNIKRYHFSMMAGKNTRYLIMEGSRGCTHDCIFCTQCRHWGYTWRTKSPKRIADEMEYLYERFGGQFLWLTDDNFEYKKRGKALWEELKGRPFREKINFFFQARTDDISNNPEIVAKLHDVGNNWILVGVENNSSKTLTGFRKGIKVQDARSAIKILNKNDIFSQGMFVIGSRDDTSQSIESLSEFSLGLDLGLAIYTILTPYPGTAIYDEAVKNNWIEDANYSHYDMVHAIMPTETLTRREIQEGLYSCYRGFYGSIPKNIAGIFSHNKIKRRTYRHMATKFVLTNLRGLI